MCEVLFFVFLVWCSAAFALTKLETLKANKKGKEVVQHVSEEPREAGEETRKAGSAKRRKRRRRNALTVLRRRAFALIFGISPQEENWLSRKPLSCRNGWWREKYRHKPRTKKV